MARTSAAYIIAIEAVLAGLMGTLLLTVLDPIWQNLFGSSLWSSSTSFGSDALAWQKAALTYFAVFILVAIMTHVWIKTRRVQS